jgi:hypothetical protein
MEGLGNRIANFKIILKLLITALKVSSGCRKDSSIVRQWLMGLNVEVRILRFACVYGLIEAVGKVSCHLTNVAHISDEQSSFIDC